MTRRAIDGFVPVDNSARNEAPKRANFGDVDNSVNLKSDQIGTRKIANSRTARDDINDSLREIGSAQDEAQNVSNGKKPDRKNKKSRNPFDSKKRNWRKIIKRSLIVIVLLVLAIGAFFVARALMAGGSVFKGDILGYIQKKELKQDSGGRSNILILGTSEDDEGHEGGYLTDSMMILSINQTKKDAYMISVPRDLYVEYGRTCTAGYAGKINAYFNCVNEDWSTDSAEEERQAASREFVGDIFGMEIQYSVHVNYSVMRDLVSALGGIKVTIESRHPDGVMDSNFDWKCGTTAAEKRERCPRGHYISYPNGEVELDAEHALYLAMARGDKAPTYGFEQSNFDREKNQQKILVAIRDKALSAGTLTDFTKVSGIIDAIGNNLRTNFETSEVRTLVDLAQEIEKDSIRSLSLIDAEPTLLTTGNYGGASAVVPTAGVYDYSGLRAYIKKNLYATDVMRENAHVVVLNATGQNGVAKKHGNNLTELGMTIDSVGNAPSGYSTNKIYHVSTRDKKATAEKLKSLYGVDVESAESLAGVNYTDDTDFVIIVAEDNISN